MATIQPSSPAAPDASLILFARGVIARLLVWPALRLAIDQSWGGPESASKRTWMASVIVDAFDPSESPAPPDEDYVEEVLLQIMADEFDAVLEDGSAESIAKDIMKIWSATRESKADTLVREWENQAQRVKGKKVEHHEEVGDDSDWSDESGSEDGESDNAGGDDVPVLLEPKEQKKDVPEIDAEGFTMVKGKGKGRK